MRVRRDPLAVSCLVLCFIVVATPAAFAQPAPAPSRTVVSTAPVIPYAQGTHSGAGPAPTTPRAPISTVRTTPLQLGPRRDDADPVDPPSTNVSTLDLVNNTVFPGLYAPLQAQYFSWAPGMAFDPLLNELFVVATSGAFRSMIEVISAGTGLVVGAYNVTGCSTSQYPGPAGPVFDPDNGLLYLPCPSAVLAIVPANGTVVATIPLQPVNYGKPCSGGSDTLPVALSVSAPLNEVNVLVASCYNASASVLWAPWVVSVESIFDMTNTILGNVTLGPTVYSAFQSWGSDPLTFDAASGQLYASWNLTLGRLAAEVTIIDPLTLHVVANLSIPSSGAPYGGPAPIAYDSAERGVLVVGMKPGNGPVTPELYLIDPNAASGVVRLLEWPSLVPMKGVPIDPVALAVGPGSAFNLTVSAEGFYPLSFELVYNLSSGTLLANISTAAAGWMVGGPGSSSVFLLDMPNARVLRIGGSPAQVMQTIPLGLTTTAATVDPATGTVYFNEGSWCGEPVAYDYCANDSVGVLSPVTERRSTAWPVTPQGVGALLFDPQNQRVYAFSECGVAYLGGLPCLPGGGTGAITAYSAQGRWLGETHLQMATFGIVPEGMALDTAAGYLLVLTFARPGVLLNVLDANTLSLVGTLPLDNYLSGVGSVVYDPASNLVYVTSLCVTAQARGDCLWALNGTTLALGAPEVLPGSFPASGEAMAFDAANNTVLVVSNGVLYTVNGSTGTLTGVLPLPDYITAVAYDPVNGVVYALGSNLTEINGTSGAIIDSTPALANPDSGEGGLVVDPTTGTAVVWYQGTGALLFVPGPGPRAYAVTFPEAGLPTGASWTVTVAGHVETGAGNLSFWLPNGSYAYSIAVVPGFEEGAIPEAGMVEVSGGPVLEPLANFSAMEYPIVFHLEPGSASHSWFAVTIQLTGYPFQPPPSPSCPVCGPNGTYAYLLEGIGSGFQVVGMPPTGTFTVNGAGVRFDFRLEPGPTPSVTFLESGLPPGTPWCATVSFDIVCSQTTTAVFSNLTPGLYGYRVSGAGYAPAPSAGEIDLGATGATVRVAFSPVTYQVTLAEAGLKPGTRWGVRLAGSPTPLSTNQRFLTLSLPNGTYDFQAVAPPGYTTPPGPAGRLWTVRVQGQPVATDGLFLPVLFNVTFNEAGLSPGSSWCVTVTGTGQVCSTRSSIVFSEMNGTYTFRIGAVPGYCHSSGAPPKAKVKGGPAFVTVRFVLLHSAPILYSPASSPPSALVARGPERR